jgi:hypothetical protein
MSATKWRAPSNESSAGHGGFRSFRKRYANQGRVDVPAQRRTAVAGIVDLGLAQEAGAFQRLDHLQRLVRVQRLAERVAAHVLAADLGGAAAADPGSGPSRRKADRQAFTACVRDARQ